MLTRVFSKFIFLLSSIAFAQKNGVIIISMDGAKPSAIKKAAMPTLNKIIKEAAVSWTSQSVVPSLTLPAHTSMLSGVEPSVHKVLWNTFEEPKGKIQIPTVFSLAKKAGLKTALVATKSKFQHFNVRGTLDYFNDSDLLSVAAVTNALEFLKTENPELIFFHLPDADHSGHKYGWDSKEQLSALAQVDAALALVVDYAKKTKKVDYTLLITSDHGGVGKNHGGTSPEEMTVPWFAWGKRVNNTSLGSLSIMDTAATTLTLLKVPAPSHWKGRFVKEAFKN